MSGLKEILLPTRSTDRSADHNSEFVTKQLDLESDKSKINGIVVVNHGTTSASVYLTEDYVVVYVALACFVVSIICSACKLDLNKAYLTSPEWPLGAILLSFGAMIPVARALDSSKQFDLFHFSLVIIIAIFSRAIGNYSIFSTNGATSSLWAIIFGFLARSIGINILDKSKLQLIPGSKKKKSYYSGEFFVKIGVVLLAMDLSSIWINGLSGLVVAWVDTLLVFSIGIIICIMLFKVNYEKAVIVAGATSICGSSAAQALASSIGNPSENEDVLKSILALMGIMNAPLMPLMPLLHTIGGFQSEVVGAWIGGSIDSTGQVTASAQMGGDKVLQTAIIIKMAQNILIAPICIAVSWYFHRSKPSSSNPNPQDATTMKVLSDNFRNLSFIAGFIFTSIVVSILLATSTYTGMNNLLIANSWFISEWITLIGFVTIGLDIDIAILRSKEFYAYLRAYLIIQSIDICSTLGWAYLMFRNSTSDDDDASN